MSEKKCKNCRFKAEATCRVNPPVRFENEQWGGWPVVQDRDWCGEFKEREVEEEAEAEECKHPYLVNLLSPDLKRMEYHCEKCGKKWSGRV